MKRTFLLFLAFLIHQDLSASSGHAYVANNGGSTVSVINLSTNTVSTTIDVGLNPYFSAVTPDGKYVYVPNGGSDTVSIIDTSSNTVVATVSVSSDPRVISITPDGGFAYVSCSTAVSVINTSTRQVIATISIPSGYVSGILFSPDGATAYIASDGLITKVNTSSNTVSNTLSISWFPYDVLPNPMVITPDGSTIYTTNFDGSPYPMYVINTATLTVITSIIPTPSSPPSSAIILPNGSFVYMVTNGGSYVYPINTSTNTLSTAISLPDATLTLAVTPNGQKVYVPNYGNGNMYYINTSDNTLSSAIATGVSAPNFPTVTPDGSFVYVCGVNNSTVCAINTSTNAVSSPLTVGANPKSIVMVAPVAVSGLIGSQKLDQYITQTETYNYLSWNLPANGVIPVSYRIYRDSALTNLAGTTTSFSFIDHNLTPNQTYNYYVVSVAYNGDVSSAASITISPL